MPAISEPALVALRSMEFEGEFGRFTCGQLDRKVYVEVDKALQALGGKWNKGKKCHVFESDSRDAVEQVIETGIYTGKPDKKKELGFFETPKAVAVDVIYYAGIENHHTVLEPSAGTGNLIKAARDVATEAVYTAVDIDPAHESAIADVAEESTVADFLSLAPDKFGTFDRVVMNPPFSRQQDIDHVRHAYSFLKEGGRLVSVMSSGWTFRENAKSKAFRELVAKHGEHFPLTEGSFKESGTGVNTVIVVLNK